MLFIDDDLMKRKFDKFKSQFIEKHSMKLTLNDRESSIDDHFDSFNDVIIFMWEKGFSDGVAAKEELE